MGGGRGSVASWIPLCIVFFVLEANSERDAMRLEQMAPITTKRPARPTAACTYVTTVTNYLNESLLSRVTLVTLI